ncbi:hypothetical protein KC19_4G119800 [Ceratodon purpureus]|uniref:BTB domain-containing protein n=1 Tax=Ceratodon purpureus TaxID=3225 RepID=A0A8T0IB58_CERPU|nr:hypothetical protein KC19_4G119800 [Ceratodon purpureus]
MTKFGLPCMCSRVEVEELQVEMQRLLEKQHFLTTWDPETFFPPHTDVILESSDAKQVYAHRATLMGKSEAFKVLFSPMLDKLIPITVKMDMEYKPLEAFIHFFYTGYIKDEYMDAFSDKLLRAADKYGISLLHDQCQIKLMNSIHPDHIFHYYILGYKSHAKDLVQAIIEFVASNFGDISEINGYDEFLKTHPAHCARLCNGVVKKLKLKLTN